MLISSGGLAFLVVAFLTIGFCLVKFIVWTKNDIKRQLQIEKVRQEKFHHESNPMVRRYGSVIIILLVSSPFVFFFWTDIGGKMLISNPLVFTFLYVAAGVGILRLYEKHK